MSNDIKRGETIYICTQFLQSGAKRYLKLWHKNKHYLEIKSGETYATVKICSVKRHYMLSYTCIPNILFL